METCSDGRWVYRTSMKPVIPNCLNKAFTLLELILVIAIIAILAAMLIPALTNREPPNKTGKCMNNLRQISLGYIIWADVNTNLFPWEVSTNAGGSMEFIEKGIATDHVTPLVTTLSNPEVLVCPADQTKRSVNSYAGFSNTNLSYFVSLDASLRPTPNPSFSILAGDRHLSLGNMKVTSGLFETTNFSVLGWMPGFHGPTKAPMGSLAFADGHCETVRSTNLPAIFQRQGITTNRLVIP